MENLELITRREFTNKSLKAISGLYLTSDFLGCFDTKPVEYHSIKFKETPRKIQLYQTQTKGGRSIVENYYINFDNYRTILSVKIRPEFNKSQEEIKQIFFDALNKEEIEVYGRIEIQNVKHDDKRKYVFVDKVLFRGHDYRIDHQ